MSATYPNSNFVWMDVAKFIVVCNFSLEIQLPCIVRINIFSLQLAGFVYLGFLSNTVFNTHIKFHSLVQAIESSLFTKYSSSFMLFSRWLAGSDLSVTMKVPINFYVGSETPSKCFKHHFVLWSWDKEGFKYQYLFQSCWHTLSWRKMPKVSLLDLYMRTYIGTRNNIC